MVHALFVTGGRPAGGRTVGGRCGAIKPRRMKDANVRRLGWKPGVERHTIDGWFAVKDGRSVDCLCSSKTDVVMASDVRELHRFIRPGSR